MTDLAGGATLLEPGPGLLGFAVAPGGAHVRTAMSAAWVLIEGGSGQVVVDGESHFVAGRSDVFGGAGWSALLGPDAEVEVASGMRAVVVWRSYDGDLETRVIEPGAVVVEERGHGAFARTVRTYVPTGPLIVGETITPAGGWSSYPPHRHEQEEAYLYRFSPADGFGMAARYEDDDQDETSECSIVRDGDLTYIPSGFHPVVTAPGYTMAYIWALAGESEVLTPTLDATHAWVG